MTGLVERSVLSRSAFAVVYAYVKAVFEFEHARWGVKG
jgi:hypothetical protein